MPKRLLNRLQDWVGRIGGRSQSASANQGPRIIPRDEHTISRQHISESAKKVLHRLNRSGHDAYLVGGGVRDLLLGGKPKDFDIATSATPEEVHELFRNSRLIGRRFRLVHVLFGKEVIEVTTFRGMPSNADADPHMDVNEQGRLLRDNVYGTQEEDALRRDFTVNALYYDIRDFTVHDYANGLEDLHHRELRLIGDPVVRYQEDPVRMLRAARFAAKLDFSIAPDTATPIRDLTHLLEDIPAARLFEEVLKLFAAGQGERTYEILTQYDLFAPLFPETAKALAEGESDAVIRQALANTDRRIAQSKPITPYFLYAALLWPALRVRWLREEEESDQPAYQALQQAAGDTVQEQVGATSIPRRFSTPMREIWELQVRLGKRGGRKADRLLEHPRFRAAYDFLLVREHAGEDTQGLGAWWTEYQDADEDRRRAMIKELGQPGGGGKRKRKRKPKPKTSTS
ncbi:poly(A) polymerase [Halospina denitrificans]|uniref:Poly(A) polymerase I n=1 Tax=Halospina denitrificans TaxID=332522 RepID=A0A4R7K1A0_9GAMM|nr:polynucleotide adenylyltransferase PcnB [Halospina denitrificans]TDT44591.1 poly(A) polymerase [Halospina denitrificans]